MGEFFPGFDRNRVDFLEGIAEHFRPALVKNRLPALNVPFPRSRAGSGNDTGQSVPFGFQLLLHLRTLGDVPGRGINQIPFRTGTPFDMPIRTILAAITVGEMKDRVTPYQYGHCLQGGLPIFRMHKVQKVPFA